MLPIVKLRIELDISTCGQCPYRQLHDTDHQTYNYEVFCMKEERIVGLIYYHEYVQYKTLAIPDWCPFRVCSKSNDRFINIIKD